MPVLKIYNKEKELILVSQEFTGDKGWGLLTDLIPNTTYEEGTYFVSWEDKNYETELIPVPRFTTESSTNKELVFYFKDALTVKPMTAYDIAVKNGFTGTEEEWVKSIKGEKGDKLTFNDLTEDDKKELQGIQGERGIQGIPGDAPNILDINGEYDITAYQPIAPNEYNAMRYVRDTNNTDEFMKGYDNYVAIVGYKEIDEVIKEDFQKVTKGSLVEVDGSDNAYATDVGTTIEHKFTGYSISLNAYTDKRGGVWKATIDGNFVKNISVYSVVSVGGATEHIITDNLENKEHTLVLEFIGQDPENPTDTPRGWVRYNKNNAGINTFKIIKKENKYVKEQKIAMAYPTSNKEYAIAVRPKDSSIGSEFFPYHGKQTSFRGENYVRSIIVDGVEKDLTKKQENIRFNELILIQKIEHRLPTDTSIRMESTFIVTMKEGKVYNDIRFKWLKPSEVTSGYVFQMPFNSNWFNSVVVDLVEQVDKSDDFGTSSNFDNNNAKLYTGLSNDEIGKDYIYQCVVNDTSVPIDKLWLQHRDERLQKLYPQYYTNTNRETGDIDRFTGYYEIKKIKDSNKIFKV